MSQLAAIPAASPHLSLRIVDRANESLRTRNDSGEPHSSCGVLSRSKRAAIPANFYGRDAYRNFGPLYVLRYVSRLVLGHCFGAYPAPCGSSLFCFDCVALRVTVSVPDPP